MKINHISISNVLGIKHANVSTSKPITLIAGNNEAGKSSLIDAISMALTGTPRRVKLKKELGKLINDSTGAKKGAVALLGNGDVIAAEIKLPKGEQTSVCHSAHLPLVLDHAAFAGLSDDERRKVLFDLAGVKPSAATIKTELAAAKCDPDLIEQIMGMARAGFPAMHDEAKQRATQAKGEWKAATGETWGSFAMLSGVYDTNAKATAAHERVKGWLAIAEQLAPAGIPGRMLAKALEPFNAELARLAGIAGWQPAAIDGEMAITYGGRPLELCSESGKWRACVMLQLVIAMQSEIRFATIDRFDVLAVPARPGFCKLADKLAADGEIDTLIVCGTLKEAPRMPANWSSLWIENGILETGDSK